MIIAKNRYGRRVKANDAVKEEGYWCPCCDSEVVLKKGNVNIHHFAHKSKKQCDDWHEPMTQWHRDWQERFPEHCREVVLEKDGVVHRADICIDYGDGKKLIIELQHSPITKEEIMKRNEFYSQFGKLIWVFDMRDKRFYKNGKGLSTYYSWSRPSKHMPLPYEFDHIDFWFELSEKWNDGIMISPYNIDYEYGGNYSYIESVDLKSPRNFVEILNLEINLIGPEYDSDEYWDIVDTLPQEVENEERYDGDVFELDYDKEEVSFLVDMYNVAMKRLKERKELEKLEEEEMGKEREKWLTARQEAASTKKKSSAEKKEEVNKLLNAIGLVV